MSWKNFYKMTSFQREPKAKAVKRILEAAVNAANPAEAVQRCLTRDGNLLRVNQREFPLNEFSSVYLISVGKAAISMAIAASALLGENLHEGLIVAKYKPTSSLPENLTFLESSHPLPDQRSLTAGENILAFLKKTTARDLVIFMISGGGSALMTSPVAGVSLKDMEKLTSLLLGCGARIDEINTLRRALDRVKGGGLARAAFPAQMISLLLSDVINSPLEAIASGPTVSNPTTRSDALTVLKKYDLLSQTPSTIIEVLQKEEEAIHGDFFSKGRVHIIGSNLISAQAAQIQAIQEGFEAHILSTSLQGEAALVGHQLATQLANNKIRPSCLILGGETTVSLGNTTGLGGRNQEVALAAAVELAGIHDVMLVTLATDGEDGPTDAAGAVVTGETLARAKLLGLDVDAHLQNHNAYPFFDALGDLLKIGPTGTNVNDLTFLFAF